MAHAFTGRIKLKISTSQFELRRAYLRGGPGAVISAVVWLAGGIVAETRGVPLGFAVLFLGGFLIFPISSLIVRVLFGRGNISPQNPAGLTVIETIFPMIGVFLGAWLLIPHRPDLVFPMSAIAVGAHYFGFRTAYGDWTNWILGGIMCLIGIGNIFLGMPPSNIVPFAVAIIECSFGIWFIWHSLSKESGSGPIVGPKS